MSWLLRATFVLLLIGSVPSLACAVPIAGEFTGEVYRVQGTLPGEISVGQTVHAMLQFENYGQAPYRVSGNEYLYTSLSPGSFLRIEIGDLVWETQGLKVWYRQEGSLRDFLAFAYLPNVAMDVPDQALDLISFPGMVGPLQRDSGFGLELLAQSTEDHLLTGAGLPSSIADIDFNVLETPILGSLGILGDTVNPDYVVGIYFDRFQFYNVPEPRTLTLAFAGLVAWAFAAGTRPRAQTIR
jgi:hypothetical protein